jgi:acetyl-CoA C-acetyltransferase
MSLEQDAIVIVSAARTPMGGMMGSLSSQPSPQLGAVAIKAALERSGLSPEAIDQVIMGCVLPAGLGCVLPAGLGQAPARQAALGAELPLSAGCNTINKMCGSGMKAVMDAHDQIKAGSSDIMVAGGMESMSQAPYLLPKARAGMRMGHGEVIDSMFFDGLQDAYEGGLMGSFAQATADDYHVSREAMDDFALESLARANKAIAEGWFEDEIAPVTIKGRKGDSVVSIDEQPGNAMPDKIRSLRPAFKKDGTVTAANSSSISDGAAALVLMRESEAKAKGLTPLARIVGHSTHAQKPAEFTIAPIGAIQKLLDKAGWDKDSVDLYEINEAFAVVRILVTLLYGLKRLGKQRGVASLCIGGGEATAIAIEML